MKRLLLLFALSSVFVLSGCQQSSEGWTGFYYPSGKVDDGFEMSSFDSETACETWAEEKMENSTDQDAHYNCGFDCTYDETGQYECAE